MFSKLMKTVKHNISKSNVVKNLTFSRTVRLRDDITRLSYSSLSSCMVIMVTSGDVTLCLAEVWADMCSFVLSFVCFCFVHVLTFFFSLECVHVIFVLMIIKKKLKKR